MIPFIRDSNMHAVCDACQKGKSHQLPYPHSFSVSLSPLELVFSDVWGPAPTSVGRNNYYVSFIDDFSKFTRIYLLRHKSEVFQRFRDFQNLVDRQFDRKILAIQMDWGGEYQSLNSFFQRVGIKHRVSCPHAHQQNGAAERKHRHIVEVGLTILAHASIPLKFWDEAFTTAVYLINSLPSKIINNETPYERLLKQPPDYTFLHVFGCACWPNLHPYNTRKLQFRSKRSVFLGYSNQHKGFKCLGPSEGRVYISRDVVFDESVFPFSTLHPNASARLRAEISLLPESHLNSSTNLGGANSSSSHARNSPPDDDITRPGRDSFVTAEKSEENGADRCIYDHYRMCSPTGGHADPGVAPPGGDSSAGELSVPTGSAWGSAPAAGSSSACRPGSSPPIFGSSTHDTAPLQMLGPSASAQTDPRQAGHTPAPSASTQENLGAGSSVASNPTREAAAAPSSTAAAPSSTPPPRPSTRSQHGIHKPKIYTDGTMRWGMFGVSIVEEPTTLDEAFGDPRWVVAMDAEHNASLHNKTWHLVPAPKGKTLLVANEYTK